MAKRMLTFASLQDRIDAYEGLVAVLSDEAKTALGEYGNRWEVLLHAVVPVAEPVEIELAELLPWNGTSKLTTQDLVWSDTRSTHLTVRVGDVATVLKGVTVSDLELPSNSLEATDLTRLASDVASIYAYQDSRPYLARVDGAPWHSSVGVSFRSTCCQSSWPSPFLQCWQCRRASANFVESLALLGLSGIDRRFPAART